MQLYIILAILSTPFNFMKENLREEKEVSFRRRTGDYPPNLKSPRRGEFKTGPYTMTETSGN